MIDEPFAYFPYSGHKFKNFSFAKRFYHFALYKNPNPSSIACNSALGRKKILPFGQRKDIGRIAVKMLF